jgi:DNA-directed RNA polymerase subunit RPC12/RpoP
MWSCHVSEVRWSVNGSWIKTVINLKKNLKGKLTQIQSSRLYGSLSKIFFVHSFYISDHAKKCSAAFDNKEVIVLPNVYIVQSLLHSLDSSRLYSHTSCSTTVASTWSRNTRTNDRFVKLGIRCKYCWHKLILVNEQLDQPCSASTNVPTLPTGTVSCRSPHWITSDEESVGIVCLRVTVTSGASIVTPNLFQ